MELKNVLVFDTETSGLPQKGHEYKTHYMEFPHVVQLAWVLNGIEKDYIIKPEGWTIPQEATDIHGVTQQMAEEKGVPIASVLDEFVYDCSCAEKIVGHNIYFDTSIIKSEVLRLGMPYYFEQIVEPVLHKDKRICTMYKTISFCDVKFSNGKGKKYPKLEELYFKLFNEEFPAHNALEDVRAVVRCLPELVKLNLIEL